MSFEWVDMPFAIQESAGLISSWTLVNMLLIKNPPEAPRPYVITSVPALAASPITSGSGAMRGMIFHADKLWYVRGTQLYYTSNGTGATLVGTAAGTLPVRMVAAGIGQIAIVDGAGNQYTATTAGLTAFALPAGTAADVAFMDGRIVCPRVGTDEWYISALDGTTFAALDFSTADAISDVLVGAIACNRDMLLFGKTHIEIWYDAGASPFPFARSSPGVIERGCIAAATIQKVDGAVYFVGDDRRAYRLRGYTPEPISTEAVNQRLNSGAPGSLSSSIYSFNDQLIYAVQVNGSITVEYNITTGLWGRRDGYPGYRVNFTPATVTSAYHAGQGPGAVVGVYRVDPSTVDSSLAYSIGAPWFDAGGRRIFEAEVELIVPPVTTGSGTVVMATSDADDGTASLTHDTVSLSSSRLNWNRCGSYRRRRHTFSFVSPQFNIVVEAVRSRIEVGQ